MTTYNLCDGNCDEARETSGPTRHEPDPNAPRIFVDTDDGCICQDCLPSHPEIDVSDDATQVWQEYSDGWLAPCVCVDCKLSIPVYVDGVQAVKYEIDCEPEDPAHGSLAQEPDPDCRALILKQIASGNTWAWCRVRVRAIQGDKRAASQWRGGCNLASEAYYRSCGLYDDQCSEALQALNDGQTSGVQAPP